MSIRVKKLTLFKYQTMIETQIKPLLGKRNINDFTSSELNQFICQKIDSGELNQKGGLSPSYVKTMTIIINSALKYAMQENLMPHETIKISNPIVSKKELEILNASDQEKLESYLHMNLNVSNLSIFLSLYAGLRIGEVCALRWKDIDLDHHVLKIRNSVLRVSSTEGSYLMIDDPKTNSSIREIPIVPSLLTLLTNYQNEDDTFVLSGTNQFIKPRTIEYQFKQILKKSGLKSLNYHALRHTFATNCIQAGVDAKSLSEILGHSNVSVTLNIYVHSSMDIKKEQLKKIERK